MYTSNIRTPTIETQIGTDGLNVGDGVLSVPERIFDLQNYRAMAARFVVGAEWGID